MIPKRRQRERMGVREDPRIDCPGHRQWVRGMTCTVADADGANCDGKIQFAHVRAGTDGSLSKKPSDCWGIPLCAHHHIPVQHQIGEPAFERRFGIDMKAIASKLWSISPHRITYERKQRDKR